MARRNGRKSVFGEKKTKYTKKMFIFSIISNLSFYSSVLLLAFCLAVGLFYLKQIAEDNSVLAKKIGNIIIYSILGENLVLMLDMDLPKLNLLFGMLSCGVYYWYLNEFPNMTFMSIQNYASLGLPFLFDKNSHISHSFFSQKISHKLQDVLSCNTFFGWHSLQITGPQLLDLLNCRGSSY